jgi:hypothetical protein
MRSITRAVTIVAGLVAMAAPADCRPTVRLIFIGRQSTAPGRPPTEVSGPDGASTFDGLPPGRYQVDAQKAGFASQLPTAPLNPGALRPFQLAAGETLGNVNIALQEGAAITDQIFDPVSGEPLADARVTAMRRPAGAVAGAARANGVAVPRLLPVEQGGQTNDLGEFRIDGLPAGDYGVAATASPAPFFGVVSPAESATAAASSPSTKAVQTFYPGTVDAADAQTATVAGGQVASGITFRLSTASVYQVSGVVVDDTGAPVGHRRPGLKRRRVLRRRPISAESSQHHGERRERRRRQDCRRAASVIAGRQHFARNQTDPALERQVRPRPFRQHGEAVAEADQPENVKEQPEEPREES